MPSVAKDKLRQLLRSQTLTPEAARLAQLRLEYSELSHTLNQYMKKMAAQERIYPRILPTQASRRWSTVDPPLTNFPKRCIAPTCPGGWHEKSEQCWSLRDCILPDEGTFWIEADLDAVEARIFALKVHDEAAIQAFNTGLDIHTPTACHLFALPVPGNLQDPHSSVEDTQWRTHVKWRGKDDTRRGIAKNFRYGTQYCLKPEAVLSIKDLEEFNLSRNQILTLAHAYWKLTAPQQAVKLAHMQRIRRDKVARTLYGFRRVFFDSSDDTAKEGFSHEISGTVTDYMNQAVIAITDRWPDCYLVHNAHDGVKLAFPLTRYTPDCVREVHGLFESDLTLEGLTVRITATSKVIFPTEQPAERAYVPQSPRPI